MKQFSLCLVGLLTFLGSSGQQLFDSSKLSDIDRQELQQFFSRFTDAVVHQDKQKLSKLFKFPFTCSQCVRDCSKQGNVYYTTVSKSSFLRSHFKTFLTPGIVEVVNQGDLQSQLHIGESGDQRRVSYSLTYPIVNPSKTWEGLQGFITIGKVGNQYKVLSAWTVP